MDVRSVLSEIKLEGKIIPITGGDVNQTYRIEGQCSYFLKIHPNIGKEFLKLKQLD